MLANDSSNMVKVIKENYEVNGSFEHPRYKIRQRDTKIISNLCSEICISIGP